MVSKMLDKKMSLLFYVFFAISIFVRVEGVEESSESTSRSWYYICPPDFIRLGNSCYYLSKKAETWQDAVFACKDRESNLTAPERWEDRNLRDFLNKPGLDKEQRWIGGMYDWMANSWKWGGEMKNMKYQSFKSLRGRSPESLMWHCVAMDPDLQYRWDAFFCTERKQYICQTRLRKVRRYERNMFRRKWNPDGNGNKPNEISVPKMTHNDLDYNRPIDNEISPDLHAGMRPHPRERPDHRRPHRVRPNQPTLTNEVAVSSENDTPKLYADGKHKRPPAPYAHRPQGRRNSTQAHNIRKKPFKGYRRNKLDPHAAYLHNVRALRSGKTGLSNAQIEKHLQRLERLRKKEEMALRRREEEREKKNRNLNAIVNDYDYTKLSHRANNVRSRNDESNKRDTRRKGRKGKKASHSLENVTQKTYVVDTQISELHPKKIVEVHALSTE